MDNAVNNKRIARNTLLLYFRMLLIMAVSLYTSRVVLATLGIEDFGIYNVIGGVVAMFAIISSTLSAAVSRFITVELGRNDFEQLKKVFSASVTIHIFLAIIIFFIAEIGGIWFIHNKLVIPHERLNAAFWVFQCSVLTFIVNLLSVPYNATIVAHERMDAFAYVSIIEVILKLLLVYILALFSFDKLIMYSFLLMLLAIIIRLIYGYYCKRHFEECVYHYFWDKSLFKEIMAFASWNFIGASSGILRAQGINVLLNLFGGPVVNAARGISAQVHAAIQSFVTNFMTALNPQITKSYVSGDHVYMMKLIERGARFSFYLFFLLSLPIVIETNRILSIWLVEVPDHTVNFVRLVLIFAMIETLSGTLITTMLATGKIKNYQIVVGGLQLMNFPVSYFLLKIGLFPEITILVSIFFSLCCLFVRLWMLKSMVNLYVMEFIRNVLLNVLLVVLFSIILPVVVYLIMDDGLYRLMSVIVLSLFSSSIIILFVGCNKQERIFIIDKIIYIINKILKR